MSKIITNNIELITELQQHIYTLSIALNNAKNIIVKLEDENRRLFKTLKILNTKTTDDQEEKIKFE
jgi:hypothetical protein